MYVLVQASKKTSLIEMKGIPLKVKTWGSKMFRKHIEYIVELRRLAGKYKT